ncbi:MAG: hypothetical protein WA102_09050 [Candidatus Methanoperedens sp.]
MKTEEKFLIRVSLNGKIYPIYWINHQLLNSQINIYFGSCIIEQKHMKTSFHGSGTMHTKDDGKTICKFGHPNFDQKLGNFKGMKQIHSGVIFKSYIEKYHLKNVRTTNKQIIDIDISDFKDLINLHIVILENENYNASELYKSNLPMGFGT